MNDWSKQNKYNRYVPPSSPCRVNLTQHCPAPGRIEATAGWWSASHSACCAPASGPFYAAAISSGRILPSSYAAVISGSALSTFCHASISATANAAVFKFWFTAWRSRSGDTFVGWLTTQHSSYAATNSAVTVAAVNAASNNPSTSV